MAYVGDEVLLQIFIPGQCLHHVVEIFHQATKLIPAGGSHTHREVSLGHLLRGFAQACNGAGNPPGKRHPQQHQGHQKEKNREKEPQDGHVL